MNRINVASVAIGLTLSATALLAVDEATVSLIVNNLFGQRFKSVRLVKFRQKDSGKDFVTRFTQMKGVVPYGSYLAEVEADHLRLAEYVTVDKPQVLAILSGTGQFIETTGHIPLTVRVDSLPEKTKNPIWIKLAALYGSGRDQVAILDSNHRCVFYDVEIGTYVAMLMSNDGILGLSQIRVEDPRQVIRLRAGAQLTIVEAPN